MLVLEVHPNTTKKGLQPMKLESSIVDTILKNSPPKIEDIINAKEALKIESPSDLWSAFEEIRKSYYEKKIY